MVAVEVKVEVRVRDVVPSPLEGVGPTLSQWGMVVMKNYMFSVRVSAAVYRDASPISPRSMSVSSARS